MDIMIQRNKPKASTSNQLLHDTNPYEELDRFFAKPVVAREHCPDIIAWWGVSQSRFASVEAALNVYYHYRFNTQSIRFYGLWLETTWPSLVLLL
jgi:hypothetical protein